MKKVHVVTGCLVVISVCLMYTIHSKMERANHMYVRNQKEQRMRTITIESDAFQSGEPIPSQFTCDEKDFSPPLRWSGIPTETKSIALICDDPDAPGGTWVHWVVFNLLPNVDNLPENVELYHYKNAVVGTNSGNKQTYNGPCPPSGKHRYFFKIYALDVVLDLHHNAKASDVMQEMDGHILAQGELMGTYERKK